MLNEKVDCHFAKRSYYFGSDKNGCMYEIWNTYDIMNIFIRSSRDPRKNANDPHGSRDPQVENHWSTVIEAQQTQYLSILGFCLIC